MNTKLFYLLLLSCFVCSLPSAYAQKKGIQVVGKVVEGNSQSPVEFATVVAKSNGDDGMLVGTTTGLDGTFQMGVESRDFYIEVSFLGLETKKISSFEMNKGRIDLGVINLSADSELLDEVEVTAERSTTEFRLDKRVFNVGQDLSSTGASALEVLDNVPSVSVNIEGQVSLRGSQGVQMLINGKPSIMASDESNALGTITADMIEKIEVITNPSAKYEAEGTSGIINIVLKKEEKEGLNGSISLNTGIPHNQSVGISLNRRTEHFNLFSQFGVGYRELPRDQRNINRNLLTGDELRSEGEEFRNEVFYNVILGTDYHINRYNVITLSGSFAYEIEDQPSEFNFSRFDGSGNLESEWIRREETEATNPKYHYELQYKRDFKDHKDHDLIFSAIGNFFGKEQSSEFETITLSGVNDQDNQLTRTEFQEAKYTFNVDYTRPFSEFVTLETGAQYVIQDVSNDFAVTDIIDSELVPNAGLTNIFEYDQDVFGVYATGAYERGKWGVKGGLRVEHTELNTLLVTTNEPGNQNYTNLFPSFHTSYKLTERLSLQAGYSRRIYRPRLWDLNPFFNIRNNFNIRQGNPDLLPEFTDSYEVTSIFILDKISMNFGVYQRYTTDVIERITRSEENVNITLPENIGTNRATGIEYNAKYTPSKKLSFNGDFNFNFFNREGSLGDQNFDFTAEQWNARLTAKFNLPAGFDVEVRGNYESAFQTVQGETADQLFANLGVRKKLLKGKAVISFSIRDIFASRIRERELFQETFYVFDRSLRGRFITLGFSYGFGKGEAMEYSGRRRR